jgi:hypothetical protein
MKKEFYLKDNLLRTKSVTVSENELTKGAADVKAFLKILNGYLVKGTEYLLGHMTNTWTV